MNIYVLSKISEIVHMANQGLYRDDGLIWVTSNKRNNDKIRKFLLKLFKALVFEIEVDINRKVLEYLNAELNLPSGSVSTYMEPNSWMKYVKAGTLKL